MRARSASKGKLQERLSALQDVSIELMTSRELRETLTLIVNKAVDLLVCDAGSLYLGHAQGTLTFEVAVNRTLHFDFERQTIPASSRGLAAYSFRSGEALKIEDVADIEADAPYAFDSSFDRAVGYKTRSVLIQPLKSTKGDILGVLQLINRKFARNQPWPAKDAKLLARMPSFNKDDEQFLRSFAAVASAAIENARLYKDIENLFEGFVKASVHAIEARDLATRGHSERVAALTVDLAEKVSRSEDADIRHFHFSDLQLAELRYASLLHDFGKIGVREATLQKEEKLSPLQKQAIRSRFDGLKQAGEIRRLRDYLQMLQKEKRAPQEMEWARLEKEIQEWEQSLDGHWQTVMVLNRPSILDAEKSEKLDHLAHLRCPDCKGDLKPLLEPDEVFSLAIKRGSLTEAERLEIESHVTHTYRFLKQIPWTRELAGVPEIAYAHHERLNGRGYPERRRGDEIPVQSRLMAICDIFDALAANDRPYKPAVPVPKALEILEMEAKMGALDARFLKVFIEAKVYEHSEFLRLQNGTPGRQAA